MILNKPRSDDVYYGYMSQEKGGEYRCWSITIDSPMGDEGNEEDFPHTWLFWLK